jgi:hypothetical protein
MLLKILPYILGTLIGVYLNYIPITPNAPTLVGVMAGLIISPIIGIPLLVVLGIVRAVTASKKTESRIRLGKKIKRLSKFIASLMGGSFFTCSFFIFLQLIPIYLRTLFKEYNPIETPINNWNSLHYYNSSLVGLFAWIVIAVVGPVFSWIISKWISSLSEQIKFSDREEKKLESFQVFLLKTRRVLWLIYGLLLTISIPILLYLSVWKGINSIILDVFPWLMWISIPILVVLILFILLISFAKAFDWDKDKKSLNNSNEVLSEEVYNSSK